jgi:PAS domain S-box-containing protein
LKPTHGIVASLAGGALLVALVVAASFWAFKQTEAAAESRKHIFVLIDSGNEFLAAMTDAETGERGYALTGNEAFLEPYAAVRDTIAGRLKELRLATTIGAAQQHLDALIPLVDAKLAQMARVIRLRGDHDEKSAIADIAGGQGKRLMDSIRAEMRGFFQIEDGALAQRDAELQSNLRRLFAITVAGSLLLLAFALAFAYFIYREARYRVKNLDHLETQHSLEIQQAANARLEDALITLEVSEERLAVTLNSIGDAVIATDAQARVTRLNTVAEQLTGWTQAEAAGRPVDDIFRIINQETRQPATIPVLATLAHGTMQGLANHTLLIARDGSECAIADSCAPIRDRDRQVVGAVLIFRDVTSEYAAQQALRDSAALIQTILNTVADGVITIHASGGIVESVNQAAERMFGYAAAELVGQKFSLLIPELDRDQRNGSIEYYSASDEDRAAGLGREVMGRRKDGSVFPLEMAASEMWLGGKRYFTGMLRDNTARKRVEAERALLDQALQDKNVELEKARLVAEKANVAKSDFLSSMSHELRTPLNAILGFTQLMESGSPPPTPSQKKNLDQILKAGWYLLELINEILDLALIESGKVTLSPEPVSLIEVMLECRTMIEPQAQKRGIRMTFPRFEVPYFVSGDRIRVKQVLINLLFNAIKYNRPEGAVTVEYTVSAPDSIRISVRDTGAGLAPEQLAQLFQPFNRLGKETGAEEGTGIGLMVTKRLVELMGGTIGADSAVGVGSVFWFELSLSTAPLLVALEAGHAAAVRPQASDDTALRRVLYVEDNPANLELVEQLIARRPDLRLLSAADGNLGIEFARVYQPEVILMDINLPGISGIEAMRVLRADPATAHIPIIALSANAVPRDIERALAAGFFRYLTKPIKVNQFMDTLDETLKFAKTQAARASKELTA